MSDVEYMNWYVVQCKAGQNTRAQVNLDNQSIYCFNPQITLEKLRAGRRIQTTEAMFPGYVFVQLGNTSKGWHTIRSTRGVHRLVAFGGYPVPVADDVIQYLQASTEQAPQSALKTGDALRITDGPLAHLEAVFHCFEGRERVSVLLELLQQPQRVTLPLKAVAKA